MASTPNGLAGDARAREDGLYSYDSFSGTGTKQHQPRETHFLWWCAGAYQELLRDCPSEQPKMAGLGGVILATFVLAALSAGYAIYSVFDNPVWAVAFALVWGAIIFNFDRFLVTTMRKYGVSRQRQIWMAMPRIAMALLIGVTIARPLELKIFEKEIGVQVMANRHTKIQQNDSLLRIENAALLLASGTERARLLTVKAGIEDTLHGLQRAYLEEADGTGGSLHRGIDKLTRMKQDAWLNTERQRRPELAQLDRQIHYQDSLLLAAQAANEVKRAAYESQLGASVGFLERNKALSDLAGKEPSVFWANLLISLLIILIEIGPILSKLIMNTGPYDIALARKELIQMAADEEALREDRERLMARRAERATAAAAGN